MNISLRHLKNNNGSWYYQRRWPRALEGHPQVKTAHFSKALRVDGSDETALVEAWNHQHKVYEDFVTLLKLANADVINAKRELELANALLEAYELEPGMLCPDAPYATDQQKAALVENHHGYIDSTGIFNDRETTRVSPQLNVLDRAWKLLNTPATEARKTIATTLDCWDAYKSAKSLDPNTRSNKKTQARWNQFASLVGDRVLTQDFVNESLRRYVEDRTGKVQPSSIDRELKTICPILRAGVMKHGLGIDVTKPKIEGSAEFVDRYVLTPEEQSELLDLIQDQSQRGYATWKEAVLLVMLQTGCITSELQRLTLDRVHLDNEVPYILIAGETKTKYRERVIPIVVKVERLKALLSSLADGTDSAFGAEYFSKDESNLSHQFKTIVTKVNPKATAYSLRHAMRNNALASGVDDATTSMLGGWSSQLAINPIQQQYGQGGRLYPETLKQLQSAMLKINQHLLGSKGGNVIQLRANGSKRV